MKIIVSIHQRVTPFVTLFKVHNKSGKRLLMTLGRQYLDNTHLYILEKMGYEIIHKKHIN